VPAGVVAALLASIFCFVMWEQTGARAGFAQGRQEQKTTGVVSNRPDGKMSLLSSLLSDDGISMRESDVLTSPALDSNTLRILLTSAVADREILTELPVQNAISLVDSRRNQGPIARQRSVELSPTLVLVVAVDQNLRALWWNLLPDPRLLRAEASDISGSLAGETLYRSTAEMLVSYPANDAITDLRFYHPNWDGQTFTLQLIGALPLPDKVK